MSIIPLAGPHSPVASLVLTGWGLQRDYRPMWQSPVLSAGQIEQIVSGAPNQVEALRAWAMRASGLDKVADQLHKDSIRAEKHILDNQLSGKEAAKVRREVGPDVPYALVGAVLVGIPLLGKLPGNFPKPLAVGEGNCHGRQMPLGLYLFSIELPPPVSPRNEAMPPGIRPAQLPQADARALAEFLTLVTWDVSHHRLLGLLGGPWRPPNLFGFDIVSGSREFAPRQGKEALPAKEQYIETLRANVVPVFPKKTVPSNLRLREFAEYSHRNIINFAASLFKQMGLAPHGPRRTAAAKVLSLEGGESNLVLKKMAEHGIEIPDPSNPVALRDALLKLRHELRPEYKNKPKVPAVDRSEDTAFAADYYDQLAQLNPRGARRPRRPRRSRRRARHNPLSEQEVEAAIGYAEDRNKLKDPGDLPGAFERLRKGSNPEDWQLTPARLGEVFPRTGGRGAWSPKERLAALSRQDLVTRVGRLPETEATKRAREKALKTAMPFEDPEVLALLAEEAELSLDDAIRMINTQRTTRRLAETRTGPQQFAVQASSAFAKIYRRRKLSNYRPLDAVFEAGDTRANRVVILMSPGGPTGVRVPRVMTWRHRVHIDADQVGKVPEDMLTLLGRAIQNTLYWLVEKPRRAQTDVYIGCVGQPTMQLALRAGDQISIAQVTKNLRDPARQVRLYKSRAEEEAQLERDVTNYKTAAARQIGADAADSERTSLLSMPAPEQAPPPAPEAAPFQADDEDVTF